MKCHNIFCGAKYRLQNGCQIYTDSGMKNCDSRKLYNLWNKIITEDKHTWFFERWKEVKDKYHGRIK